MFSLFQLHFWEIIPSIADGSEYPWAQAVVVMEKKPEVSWKKTLFCRSWQQNTCAIVAGFIQTQNPRWSFTNSFLISLKLSSAASRERNNILTLDGMFVIETHWALYLTSLLTWSCSKVCTLLSKNSVGNLVLMIPPSLSAGKMNGLLPLFSTPTLQLYCWCFMPGKKFMCFSQTEDCWFCALFLAV